MSGSETITMGGDSKRNLGELLRAGGYLSGAVGNDSPRCLTEASKPVLRRIRALKKHQLDAVELESQFYERVHALEKEFEPLFNQLNEKRKAIVTGQYEPTDEEAKMALIHGRTEAELQKLEDDAPVEGTPSKGVPSFWFNCLNNTAQIADTIREYDAPILKHLNDISVEVHLSPPGFTLSFHFDANEYFENTVLTKYYELNLKPEAENPFSYDGPTVIKCKGDQINWKEDKSVTQKVVKKKAKKGPQAGQYITKVVSNESFFKFFDPEEKVLEEDADNEEQLHNDFEIGQIIRDQIIPRAVLFWTGEAADDDDDFFEDDEDEDGDMDDDNEP